MWTKNKKQTKMYWFQITFTLNHFMWFKAIWVVRMIFIFLMETHIQFSNVRFFSLSYFIFRLCVCVEERAPPGLQSDGLTDGDCRFDWSEPEQNIWEPTSVAHWISKEHLLFGRISNIFVCESAIRIRLCISRSKNNNNNNQNSHIMW